MNKLFYIFTVMTTIFTVSCSDCDGDVPVETKLSISTSAITIESDGGNQTISVTASGQWTINGIFDWCIPSTTNSSGDGLVTFYVAENTSTTSRKATFTFKCGDKSTTLVIIQKQKDALTVTSSKYEIEAEGGEIQIEVKANIDFEYVVDESAKDWITYKSTRAMKTSTLVFKIAENGNTEKREGKINIKSGSISEIISVCQNAAEPILSVTDSYEINYNDTDLNIEYESNFECIITIPEDCEWISMTEKTRTIEAHSIKLSIAKNTSINSRTTNLSIHNTERTISKTISITQNGSPRSEALPAANEIWYTTIDGGKINPIEKEFGATIISHTYADGIGIVVFDKDIPYVGSVSRGSVFSNSEIKYLTSIILPEGISKIGYRAFYNATNLKRINIPNTVTQLGYYAFFDCI